MRRYDLLIVPAGGERALLGFGEGLVALAFASAELSRRAQLIQSLDNEAGAPFRPHVSFALRGWPPGADPTPYDGALIFGPEISRPAWP